MEIFVKHIKLFEAIGLALLLLSWALDWNNFKKYDEGLSQFTYTHKAIQEAYARTYNSSEGKLNNAITRAIIIFNSPKMRLNNYKDTFNDSWKYHDVRKYWTELYVNQLIKFQQNIKTYKNMNTRFSLELEVDIESLIKKIEPLEKQLHNATGTHNRSHNVFIISDASKSEIVPQFDKYLQVMDDDCLAIDKKIFSRLNDNKRKWSIIYKIMYGMGALLMILPKIMEWRGTFKMASLGSDRANQM